MQVAAENPARPWPGQSAHLLGAAQALSAAPPPRHPTFCCCQGAPSSRSAGSTLSRIPLRNPSLHPHPLNDTVVEYRVWGAISPVSVCDTAFASLSRAMRLPSALQRSSSPAAPGSVTAHSWAASSFLAVSSGGAVFFLLALGSGCPWIWGLMLFHTFEKILAFTTPNHLLPSFLPWHSSSVNIALPREVL